MTGDLIKIQLRDGTQYSCTGVVDFLQPVLDEYLHDYPEIPILLRGDSGFSTPDLYKQCEENGTSYVIRLKENVFFPLRIPIWIKYVGSLDFLSYQIFILHYNTPHNI